MPYYPTIFQVNLRVVLNALTKSLGRQATFDDISDDLIADWTDRGFDWIWLLSVWQTGPAARSLSRNDANLRAELQDTIADLTDECIGGSGFAIQEYTVSRELGGDASLARLRERMKSHGLKLMLDFVPNHMAPDHRWVDEHPDYFVLGAEEDLAKEPQNYRRVDTLRGQRIIALGRDPHFAGWADTLQLNYGNLALQQAMREELQRISQSCDGVRCDMAMLILPAVFHKTWGMESQSFWPNAIRKVRESHPNFLFLAEVYWDLEWELQQQGFDYCYDKRLYDRLRDGAATPVHWHLVAGLDYQNRLARFLENHDEKRAAELFPFAKHRAAAVVTYLTPGLRFFHQGQLEGYRKRISPHLVRGPDEQIDPDVVRLYDKVLELLRRPSLKEGNWKLLDPKPIGHGDLSNENIIAFQWDDANGSMLLVAVNYSELNSRACIEPQGTPSAQAIVRIEDLFLDGVDNRDRMQWTEEGLRIELPAWGVHVVTLIHRA